MAAINKLTYLSRNLRRISPIFFARASVPTCHNLRLLSTEANVNPVCWDRAVSDAEKIVGYPTSFANLRWLLSDEIANVALHLRKLVGSRHPILKTAKGLLNDSTNNLQAWGLLILLVSKAAGPTPNIMCTDQLEEGGVLHSQRVLAEATEMIKTGHLVHKGLINLSVDQQIKNTGNMNFGNKIALLTGDYLLVKANGMISNLRNQHMSELISSALRDLTEAEFVGDRDPQNFPIPTKPVRVGVPSGIDIKLEIANDPKLRKLLGHERMFDAIDTADCVGYPVREWTMRNVLGGGTLLGIGCQGALHLGGHEQELQDLGYLFGCHVALAWQASADFKLFSLARTDTYSLVCAPVLFALHYNPSLYDQLECANRGIDDVNYEAFKMNILKGPALEHTMDLYHEHSKAAIELLERFPKSDATKALKNIILAMNIQ